MLTTYSLSLAFSFVIKSVLLYLISLYHNCDSKSNRNYNHSNSEMHRCYWSKSRHVAYTLNRNDYCNVIIICSDYRTAY